MSFHCCHESSGKGKSSFNHFVIRYKNLILIFSGLPCGSQSEKYRAATYLVNWRATGKDVNLHDREGYAKLLMAQESTCTTANPDSNFSALFAEDSVPTKWKMDETHAEDKPFTDLEGRCRSRSKVTLAISQDNVAIHIHLNHVSSHTFKFYLLHHLHGSSADPPSM